jgi:hypothetical protein
MPLPMLFHNLLNVLRKYSWQLGPFLKEICMLSTNMSKGASLGVESNMASDAKLFTVEVMDILNERNQELARKFESEGDFFIDELEQNFPTETVLQMTAARALLTVGKIVNVGDGHMRGVAVDDSLIEWGKKDPKFMLEGIAVDIKKGAVDFVDVVVQRPSEEKASVLIEIEMAEVHFNMLIHAIEKKADYQIDEDFGQPELAVEALNLLYQEDRLAMGWLTRFTATSHKQGGYSVTVSL